MFIDKIYGLGSMIHYLHGYDLIEVFRIIIFFRCGFDLGNDLSASFAASDLHAVLYGEKVVDLRDDPLGALDAEEAVAETAPEAETETEVETVAEETAEVVEPSVETVAESDADKEENPDEEKPEDEEDKNETVATVNDNEEKNEAVSEMFVPGCPCEAPPSPQDMEIDAAHAQVDAEMARLRAVIAQYEAELEALRAEHLELEAIRAAQRAQELQMRQNQARAFAQHEGLSLEDTAVAEPIN